MQTLRGDSFKGCLLAASPALEGDTFERSVVFIFSHDESGAMGLVINRVFEGLHLNNLLQQMGFSVDHALPNPVYAGGPMEGGRGFVLHTPDYQTTDTVCIQNTFSVSSTIEILASISQGEGPEEMILALGYSAWEPGQLDEEVHANSWIPMRASPEVVFQAASDKKWDQALHSLGIEAAMIAMEVGHA